MKRMRKLRDRGHDYISPLLNRTERFKRCFINRCLFNFIFRFLLLFNNAIVANSHVCLWVLFFSSINKDQTSFIILKEHFLESRKLLFSVVVIVSSYYVKKHLAIHLTTEIILPLHLKLPNNNLISYTSSG